jgi:hypothetical protein
VQEQKGLDMVRRDWCPLSKDVGNFALREILSAKPKEDVVTAIHDHLNKVSCSPHTLAGLDEAPAGHLFIDIMCLC